MIRASVDGRNYCGWGLEDRDGQDTMGGRKHTHTECQESCLQRGDDCMYATRSSTGLCHTFTTCNGATFNGEWTMYQKKCGDCEPVTSRKRCLKKDLCMWSTELG